MSTTEKRPYRQMHTIASAVVEKLRPACHRIEIAGSLRRRKPMVGDIEIVCIPKMDTDLFGNPLDTSEVDYLLSQCPIELHKNGKKYKQFSFIGTSGCSYTIDLFLQPDPATWAVNFLIRTGSADFSRRMVTSVAFGGFKPDAYEIRDACVWHRGAALDLTDESEIFDLWGMEFVKPEERN